jgi:hypothetical protein
MIEPRDPADGSIPAYSVADIENRRNGDLLHIGLYWNPGPGYVYEVFSNLDDFMEYVLKRFRKYKQLRMIYAHNGANYDWLYIMKWIIENNPEWETTTQLSGSKAIFMKTWPHGRKHPSIAFSDSLRLLPYSLKDLSKSFGVTMKIDLSGKLPEQILDEDPALYFEYLRADCVSLAEILNKFHYLINTEIVNIDHLKFTIASLAKKIFCTGFLPEPIVVPWAKEQKELERKSYHGGMVFCPKDISVPMAYVYDVNSMYASIMKDIILPVNSTGTWTHEYRGKLGIYHGFFTQPENGVNPICYDLNGKQVYQGEGNLTSYEIDYLISLGGSFTCIEGIEYIFTGKPFEKYVTVLWGIRRKAQKEGQTALELIVKLLMNSLYGKFGQKEVGQSVKLLRPDEVQDLMKKGVKVTPLRFDLYTVETRSYVDHTFVAIASMITAQARIMLHKAIQANRATFLYADTDSIFISGEPVGIPIGTELGEWKLEKEGPFSTIGRKSYTMYNEMTKPGKSPLVNRCKGASLKETDPATFALNVKEITEGVRESMIIKFTSPPTVKEVFRGSTPGLFLPRTKRIRSTSDETRQRIREQKEKDDYKRQIAREEQHEKEEFYKRLFEIIRANGGIDRPRNGYSKSEYANIPPWLRRRGGMYPDNAAELLKTTYPEYGIEDVNSLYNKLREYEIAKMI